MKSDFTLEDLVNLSYDELTRVLEDSVKYNRYRDEIFRRKIVKEYPCIKSNRDIYMIVKGSSEYSNLCIEKMGERCQDMDRYIIYAIRNLYDNPFSEKAALTYKIKILKNVYKCYEKIKERESWWEISKIILIEQDKSAKWLEFMKTFGNTLLTIANIRFSIEKDDVLNDIMEERRLLMEWEE